MKEHFKKAVAEVEEQLGTLEGFIVMAIDDKKQLTVMQGKYAKMFAQIAGESDEVLGLMEKAIKAAKLRAKLHAIIDEAKAQGLISDKEIEEAKAQP